MMIDPAALKARAMAVTGLRDFGDAPMDDGLTVFCEALSTEADLDDKRRAGAEASIVATLSERLRVEEWLARHPEILEQRIEAPIMVVGLPRTGTTALSQFLSEDPGFRSIRRWESTALTPPPDASDAADPRIAATAAAFAARDAAMPVLKTMLPLTPGDPSEHGIQLGLTFRNMQLPSLYRIPSYQAWLLAADLKPAFEYFGKVLKLLQWRSPAPVWNLKNPPDIFAIDAIDAAFPDARFVWTHRDPADSIPSVCSLVGTIRTAQGEALDKAALGKMQVKYQSEGVRRAMAARDRIGEARFTDMYQRDMSADGIGAVAAVYEGLGLEFTDAFRAHLEARLASRPPGQFGKHRYTLEEFGIELPVLRNAFADYIKRFDVPLEA